MQPMSLGWHDRKSPKKPSATVRVLEPDILARMAISEYLSGCGYKVVEGVRAEDALTVLRSGMTVDVILAEVRMAGELDGLELAKQIRSDYPGTDITFIVGVANAADRAAKLCDDGPLKKLAGSLLRKMPAAPRRLPRGPFPGAVHGPFVNAAGEVNFTSRKKS